VSLSCDGVAESDVAHRAVERAVDESGEGHPSGQSYRIELEDVSQNLNKSKYIDSAVAVPRYNKDHKVQNLLAYVILKDGVAEQFEREIDITKAIKEDLEDIMMSYMMPSKFLYRESLPLTPNGKIDIKGLISEVNNR